MIRAVHARAASLCLALALVGGCKDPEPGGNGTKPPPTNGGGAEKVVHHRPLKDVETRIEAAITGGDNAGAAQAASDVLAYGATDIRKDEPPGLSDENKLRYADLVSALEKRVTELKAAAEANETLKTRRGFQQMTASCVQCHDAFGAPRGSP
jgi:hypothetical protein